MKCFVDKALLIGAGPPEHSLGVPTVAQWVKNPEFPELWLRFDPWPENIHVPRVQPKKTPQLKIMPQKG